MEHPIALSIGRFIHDFEIDASENPNNVKHPETLGLVWVLKGLEKISKTDHEIIEKAFVVLDAFSTSLN